MDGKFIVFEGPDGCGKTTVINHVGKALKEFGHLPIFITREPGGLPVAEDLRGFIKNNKLSRIQQTLLFMTSMNINITNSIKPELEKGNIVLCDRWLRSTYIYQEFYKQDKMIFNVLSKWACENLLPDYEIVLDVDPDISWERINKRKGNYELDSIESEGKAFMDNINFQYRNTFGVIKGWDYPQDKIHTSKMEMSDVVNYSIEYILHFLGFELPNALAYDITKEYEDSIDGKWYI